MIWVSFCVTESLRVVTWELRLVIWVSLSRTELVRLSTLLLRFKICSFLPLSCTFSWLRSVSKVSIFVDFSFIEASATIKSSDFSLNELVSVWFCSSSCFINSWASSKPGLLDSSFGSVPIATSEPSSKPSLSVSAIRSLVPYKASCSWVRPSPSVSSVTSSLIVITIDASSDSPLVRVPTKLKLIDVWVS